MAESVANVSFRIDRGLKDNADRLFAELGLNMTTAFNMFLRQSVREGRIPFEITLSRSNDTTVKAIKEGRNIAKDPLAPGYTDMESLREALEI